MKLNERNLVYYATCKSPVDKSGYLYKKGERNASYHKRWFVLKGNMLFYYDSEDSKEPVGVIILEGCRVELCESTEEFAFAIRFGYAKSRAYILAADSQSTMESWVKALSRANFEYIRLVVKDLQEQLTELQKSQTSSSCTQGSIDTNPNFQSADQAVPSFQNQPSIKDNGCALWNSISNDLPNGFTITNGPKCKDTTENLADASGRYVKIHSLEPEKTVQAGFVGGEECTSDESDKDLSNFSKLHDFYGEEIEKLRTQWAEHFHKQS
ncbi:sesquipedalian-1 [Pseudophryne corroboree]|uniref:sesquipedalian-1 n=1 Tax=Pseudophryne corroboree TaxID=495146 RepID=UPI0030813A68